jgi:hypothetical protein
MSNGFGKNGSVEGKSAGHVEQTRDGMTGDIRLALQTTADRAAIGQTLQPVCRPGPRPASIRSRA